MKEETEVLDELDKLIHAEIDLEELEPGQEQGRRLRLHRLRLMICSCRDLLARHRQGYRGGRRRPAHAFDTEAAKLTGRNSRGALRARTGLLSAEPVVSGQSSR